MKLGKLIKVGLVGLAIYGVVQYVSRKLSEVDAYDLDDDTISDSVFNEEEKWGSSEDIVSGYSSTDADYA